MIFCWTYIRLTGYRLGDNLSEWGKYRISIAQILSFASIFQIPMVGSDVCGFGGNTTEELCARWATLGAFYTFYRNHNEIGSIPQEFYRWPSVAAAARKVIDIRYRLLDYLYTSFHRQTQTGEPFLQPLFYLYPEDPNTFPIDLQFFFGDAILVSPVTDGNLTSVDAYFPDDIFYDWFTGLPLRGTGCNITIRDVSLTDIPIHIRGGSIIPLRTSSAYTTTALRQNGFELLIAPGLDGTATGSLYIDDGDSIEQRATLEVKFEYRNGRLRIDGTFVYCPDVSIEAITLLGQRSRPRAVAETGGLVQGYEYNATSQSVTAKTTLGLTGPVEVSFK